MPASVQPSLVFGLLCGLRGLHANALPLLLYRAFALLLGGLLFGLHLPLNLSLAFSAFTIQPTLVFSPRTVGLSSIFVISPSAVESSCKGNLFGAAPNVVINHVAAARVILMLGSRKRALLFGVAVALSVASLLVNFSALSVSLPLC